MRPASGISKEGAQEAHEAIRPTHPEVEEAGENPDEQALDDIAEGKGGYDFWGCSGWPECKG